MNGAGRRNLSSDLEANEDAQSSLYVPLPAAGDYYATIGSVTLPENPNLAFTSTFIIQ